MKLSPFRIISHKLNGFVDKKFNNYRGEISTDIAKAVAVLAVIVAIWTMTILFVVFAGIALGLFVGYLTKSNLLGFSIIAGVQLLLAMVVILFRKELVERPVYLVLSAALRGEPSPETLHPSKKEIKIPESVKEETKR